MEDKVMKTKSKILVAVLAVFFIVAGNAFALPFNYNGSPYQNIDQDYLALYIDVPDTGIISDMNVSLIISEPFVDDMYIRLYRNDSKLFNYIFMGSNSGGSTGGTLGSYINATFDDQASEAYPLTGQVDGNYGIFKPYSPLSVFNGTELSGRWYLIIRDIYFPGDGNDLFAWSISGTTTDVPEPATVLLLGLGLLGVAGIRRKIKK